MGCLGIEILFLLPDDENLKQSLDPSSSQLAMLMSVAVTWITQLINASLYFFLPNPFKITASHRLESMSNCGTNDNLSNFTKIHHYY